MCFFFQKDQADQILAVQNVLILESLSITFTADAKTAEITSDFLFFSCNPEINHTKLEKCLLLFTTDTNILILLY